MALRNGGAHKKRIDNVKIPLSQKVVHKLLKENHISKFSIFSPYFFIYFYYLSNAVTLRGKKLGGKTVQILSMCIQSRKKYLQF